MTGAVDALQRNWPEYLIEGSGLGVLMIMADVRVMLLEHKRSPLAHAIPSADLRHALIGVAMGLTAIAIISSPWGRPSGAHLKPAVTLTFLRLRKISPAAALCYVLAQFAAFSSAGTNRALDELARAENGRPWAYH